MNIAVIGSGAREHAIVEKCLESTLIKKIITINMFYYDLYPTFNVSNISFDYSTSDYIVKLYNILSKLNIDIAIIGPEIYLVDGIVDYFNENGIKCFGPDKKSAMLEGSKSYAKDIMIKYNLLTSPHRTFNDFESSSEFLKNNYLSGFQVIKVSGLAGGKGVCVCNSLKNGINFLNDVFIKNKFGKHNHTVLLEQKLVGQEVSLMGFCNGKTIEFLQQAQDYKRLNDNNTGPNTGGMGAICPVNILNESILNDLREKCNKLVKDFGYIGILYLGLLLQDGKPYILEFNCRFGDPEAQILLKNIKNDFVQLISDCIRGDEFKLELDNKIVMNVVCAHHEYTYSKLDKKDYPIIFINYNNNCEGISLYFTDPFKDAHLLKSKGGRTLSVVGSGNSYIDVYRNIYEYISKNIKYDGLYYRTDIGLNFIIDNKKEKRKYRIACIGDNLIEHSNIVLNIKLRRILI